MNLEFVIIVFVRLLVVPVLGPPSPAHSAAAAAAPPPAVTKTIGSSDMDWLPAASSLGFCFANAHKKKKQKYEEKERGFEIVRWEVVQKALLL